MPEMSPGVYRGLGVCTVTFLARAPPPFPWGKNEWSAFELWEKQVAKTSSQGAAAVGRAAALGISAGSWAFQGTQKHLFSGGKRAPHRPSQKGHLRRRPRSEAFPRSEEPSGAPRKRAPLRFAFFSGLPLPCQNSRPSGSESRARARARHCGFHKECYGILRNSNGIPLPQGYP